MVSVPRKHGAKSRRILEFILWRVFDRRLHFLIRAVAVAARRLRNLLQTAAELVKVDVSVADARRNFPGGISPGRIFYFR